MIAMAHDDMRRLAASAVCSLLYFDSAAAVGRHPMAFSSPATRRRLAIPIATMAMSKSAAATIYALTIAFFGVFFLWPIFQTLSGALLEGNHFTFAFIREVFRNQ